MAISFFNVKTGEKRTVDTEPMIAAFFNSSDQHVNATLGQDFGWRLAPETVKRMRDIMAENNKMNQIATTFQLPLDGVSKTDVVRWISLEDARKEQEAEQTDYTREYEEQIRALEQEDQVKNEPNPSQRATPQKKAPQEE